MVTFNTESNWAGDYASLGVTAMEMDLKNFGRTSLEMRIALKTNDPGQVGYASTTAFTLLNDGGWHHALFMIDAADLTKIGNGPLLDSLLSNVPELRILSASAPSISGDQLVGQLGVDNIHALSGSSSVPEPSAITLLAGFGISGAGFWLHRKRRRRSA